MNVHNLKITVSDSLYLKNPDSSVLGHSIISGSIELIDSLGFESFTFKKLSTKISSPESSIYRYFENKHTLLVYLASWYWSWTDYRIVLSTINVFSPIDRLNSSIEILTRPVLVDRSVLYVNEILLSRIIISESVKAHHTKEVDKENKNGCFEAYKNVVKRVSDIVLEINNDFEYPHMLISTLVEGAHQQRYFSEHLPKLTDIKKGQDSITLFYKQLVFKMIGDTSNVS